jgi:hypothetical protein
MKILRQSRRKRSERKGVGLKIADFARGDRQTKSQYVVKSSNTDAKNWLKGNLIDPVRRAHGRKRKEAVPALPCLLGLSPRGATEMTPVRSRRFCDFCNGLQLEVEIDRIDTEKFHLHPPLLFADFQIGKQ